MANLQLPSTPLDPLEPVREAQPPPTIKKTSGSPRTPSKPKGSSRITLWENGKLIEYGAQDVRLKQATPAGNRLQQLQSQAGVTANPEDPCPEHQGVFCIPLCHL